MARNRHVWLSLLSFAGVLLFKRGPAWLRWLAGLIVAATFWYERQDFFRMLAVFLCGREYIDEDKTYRRYLDRDKDKQVTGECERSQRVLHLAMTGSGMVVYDYFSHELFEPLTRARGKLDSAVRLDYGVTFNAKEVKALLDHLEGREAAKFLGENI